VALRPARTSSGATAIYLDSAEVEANLAKLAGAAGKRGLARALRGVSFDVLEGEADHLRGLFAYASGATESFLVKGLRFDLDENRLVSRILPKPGSAEILADQAEGGAIDADNTRLELGDKLAIPVAVRRNARGRVPGSEEPARLLSKYGTVSQRGTRRRRTSGGVEFARRSKTRSRVFVSKSGRALIEAARGRIRVLYALAPVAKIRPVFRFYDVAEAVARAKFPMQVKRALERALRA
jgi:hypothetical protein